MLTAETRLGDNREILRDYPEQSFDVCICDPPYEIGLMGQSWDKGSGAHDPATWELIGSRLKPGSWVAAFGARRTVHRLTTAMEQAKLDIVNQLIWIYTTGAVTNRNTQFKSSWEPIVLAQVPTKRSIKATVAQYGTGYLNVDDIRIPYASAEDLAATRAKNPGSAKTFTSTVYGTNRPQQRVNGDGRHPADLILDDGAAGIFGDDQRFFHICPKASKKERDAGLDGTDGITANPHQAVKPIELLRLLAAGLCPVGGTILDPYMGSGSGGCAAVLENRSYLGIEEDPVYAQVADMRIEHWRNNPAPALRDVRFRPIVGGRMGLV